MNEINQDSFKFDIVDFENKMIQQFGEKHIEAAIRIATTSLVTPYDDELIYEAVNIALCVYSRKLRNGELDDTVRIH